MQAEIFETLKAALRAQKITYAELARRLGTSEPTIKRVFSTRDDKLSRIVEICEVLNLSLDDVIVEANRAEVKPLDLGDRVEAKLADDPSLFHVFILLQDGMSRDEIERNFGLSANQMFHYGQRLEALGLVEVHAEGRIKLLIHRPIHFRRDGPLHRYVMQINLDFMRNVFMAPDAEDAGFVMQSRRISEQTARHMMREIRKLSRELSDMARRDQLTRPAHELESYKFCGIWARADYARLFEIKVE